MFTVFDKNENYIGRLKDVLEASRTEELNGEDILRLATLDNIDKGHRVVFKDVNGRWHEYIVKEIEESHLDGVVIKQVFCESSLYETLGDYIEDKRPQNAPANIALANALLTTRWEVGTVDDLGLNSTNFYHISAKEAIQKVAETWKGELRTRIIISGKEITHRYVDLLARRGGDYGKRFTYTKNLESVTKTVHSDDVVTALYGYGKGEEVGDGYGRRLDFADINEGKAYVEDLTALEIWGRNNADGTKSHVFSKVEFDDVEDKTELLTLTTEKLSELSEPKITYEANVIDLGGADLGDDVAVIDKEFTPELRLKARVIKVERDLLETQNDEITLGNFMPSVVDSLNSHDSYISNFRDKQGVWDRSNTINSDGTINAQFLNNLVDELNTRMNSQGGYVFISEDGKGLTTYDAPNLETATMAIQLLGGSFRIANSKLPDGSFDWRTFGDGNGFVADSFIGGLLKGGKVEFDLTNGTFLIGDSEESYALKWDGSTLKLNGLGIESYASKAEVLTTKQEAIDESAIDAASKANTAENNAKAYTDAVEIGGRNLLEGSSQLSRSWETDGYGSYLYLLRIDIISILNKVKVGDIVTFSLDVEIEEGMSTTLRIYDSNGNPDISFGSYTTPILSGGKHRISFTKTLVLSTRGSSNWIMDVYNSNNGVKFSFSNVKIEKGNKATDWTPAPEDVETYAETKASEAQSASEAYALAQANLAQTTAQAYADGIVDAEEQARIDDATAKLNEAKTYADTKKAEAITAGEVYADLKKQEAISASEAYANAKAEAERLIAEAYADGIVTAEEQARIDDVNAKLATAQLYAETKASEAETASKAYTDIEIAPIETRLTTAESSITQNSDEIALRVTQVELTNAVNAIETDTKNLFVLNDIEATGVTVETNGISIDQQESTSNTGEYSLGLVAGQEYSAQAMVSLVTGTANANYGKVVLVNPVSSAEITIVNGGADGVSQTNFIAPSDIADYTYLIFYGVLDGVVSVSQIQIVKGALIPKWALSYEDVQARIDGKVDPEQLNYEVSVLQSSIQQTSDSILQTVSETISDSGANITAQYSAEVQLAKDEFSIQLSQTNDSITDINNELADIGRYLNFDIAQGLMIGLEDSEGTARMLLDGKSLQFLDDGSGSVEDIVLHEDAVAYIGGKKLYINEAEILEKIRIGNHQMEKYSTGITIFKYVG